MKLDDLLILTASILLLVVNWLAFHDLHELHTVRDWLMLFASVVVLLEFARELWSRHFRKA